MVTIYNTPLSTTSEKALFGRPGGDCLKSQTFPSENQEFALGRV